MSKQQYTLMRFDPATGVENPYPSHAEQWRDWHGRETAWLFNPWSGTRRDARDVGSDVGGHLIMPPGEPLFADTEGAGRRGYKRGIRAALEVVRAKQLEWHELHQDAVICVADGSVGDSERSVIAAAGNALYEACDRINALLSDANPAASYANSGTTTGKQCESLKEPGT